MGILCGTGLLVHRRNESTLTNCEAASKGRFAGKNIIITGGAGTFGANGAKYFLIEGANVALIDVNKAALDEVVSKLKPGESQKLRGYVCDIRDFGEVTKVVEEINSGFGGCDLLWNNAGIQGDMKPLLEYSSDDVKLVMEINVVGAFNVSPEMCKVISHNAQYPYGTARRC